MSLQDEYALREYDALRAEILAHQGHKYQAISVAFVVGGASAAFAVQAGRPVMFTAVGVLEAVLACSLLFQVVGHDASIQRCARQVRLVHEQGRHGAWESRLFDERSAEATMTAADKARRKAFMKETDDGVHRGELLGVVFLVILSIIGHGLGLVTHRANGTWDLYSFWKWVCFVACFGLMTWTAIANRVWIRHPQTFITDRSGPDGPSSA